MSRDTRSLAGLSYAFGAYLIWGLFPAWWKQLAHVPALEIIAHRVLWSFVFVAVLLSVGRRWREFGATLRDRRKLVPLLATTSLISCNWFLFIWAVNGGHVMQASLGYYINPLVNVLLARVALGERLRRPQLVAVVLAGAGVINLAVALGEVPWVSLILASTFGLYGLIRKAAPVEPLTGLAVETGLAAPVAAMFLVQVDGPALGANLHDTLFLLGSGAATAIPLLWFAMGAKRLRYSTMGIVQYVAPTCQLALAVLAYGEAFTTAHAVTFSLIWTAVILYAADGLRARPREVEAPAAPAALATRS